MFKFNRSSVLAAIAMMKKAGLTDAQISIIIQDIRSASIADEYFRIKCLVESSPPPYDTLMEIIRELDIGDFAVTDE